VLNLLGDFIGELRAAGIPISMSEHVDSAKAMEVIDLSDRSLVKNSLAATLVKDGDHMPVFNTPSRSSFRRARGTPPRSS